MLDIKITIHLMFPLLIRALKRWERVKACMYMMSNEATGKVDYYV